MNSKDFRTQVEDGFDLDRAGPTARLVFDELLALIDQLAALEEAITEHGLMVTGARGQIQVNPAVAASRQHRVAIARLAHDLGLENESEGTRAGRAAAEARWGK